MERTIYRLRAMDKGDFFGKTATVQDFSTRSEAIEAMNALEGKTGAIFSLQEDESGEMIDFLPPLSF